jgi:hypothetical protein
MLQRTNFMWASEPESELEKELFSGLNPVKPDPIFVTRLEDRLKKQSMTVLEPTPLLSAYLVIAIGFMSGVLLLWLLHVIYYAIRRLSLRG